jgi:hypothetical protein
MLALALTLHLLGDAPPPALPAGVLVRPLSLRTQGAPEYAPPLPPAPAEEGIHVRAGVVVAASAGIFLADVVTASVVLLGLVTTIDDAFEGRRPSSGTDMLIAAGLAGFVFLPPAAGVWGARIAGARGDAGARAYWLAFLVRAAGMLAVASIPHAAESGIAGALFVTTDLVVAPYVIARVLAGAPPRPAANPAPALAFALPVRDPALPLGRAR